ncbi:hypothetical protein FVEG_02521 [Fusarium verticillioides 7600]|uniref:Uncharacterized protein n=1 Tax=Gibberella moniliformis (strain M3125 / FGSC 7600) TaxID=334819 RepID=W7LWH1_GIBM7|nr:hypothetical protein FVEG_02521 [Fusarium verticillioides 7600]XP_018746047.1 hypothetical protein FVEG_02521 [Fusarium verticillioides 7600]EWG39855.1 hypothetical protein FVEG_02521 [Fusarium verticillioides 7600]EWG39856.1 hypothetical protein FVEG_02521 [Fusarium verticillioides 7600]
MAIFRDHSAAKVGIGVDMRTSLGSTLLTRQHAFSDAVLARDSGPSGEIGCPRPLQVHLLTPQPQRYTAAGIGCRSIGKITPFNLIGAPIFLQKKLACCTKGS